MHLLCAFGPGITEGGKTDESHTRLQPQMPGHIRGALCDVCKVLLVRPFMHQGIGYHHDPALVHNGGYARGTMFRIGIEHMVDQFHDMRGFPCCSGNQPVSVTMRQHQCRKYMPVTRRETMNVMPVMTLALQAGIKMILVGIQMPCVG